MPVFDILIVKDLTIHVSEIGEKCDKYIFIGIITEELVWVFDIIHELLLKRVDSLFFKLELSLIN